jgi:hypothetical protein
VRVHWSRFDIVVAGVENVFDIGVLNSWFVKKSGLLTPKRYGW